MAEVWKSEHNFSPHPLLRLSLRRNVWIIESNISSIDDNKKPHRLSQHGEEISNLYDGHTNQKRGQIDFVFSIMPKGIIPGAVQGLQAKSCKTSTLHCCPASPPSPSAGRVASHRGEPYLYHPFPLQSSVYSVC